MLMICVRLSHKKETSTSLIESLNNGPEHYVSTDEVSFIVKQKVISWLTWGGRNN